VCSERVWTGEPRQAGPGRRAGACLSARGEVAQAETLCDTTVWSARRANLSASILIPVWVERMAALLSDRTTSVGLRHRGGLEVS
jgi:hypothetical protein